MADNPDRDLAGDVAKPRVSIVTGAAAGIGAATAEYLAAAGDWVFCVDKDAAGVSQTVQRITQAGGTAIDFTADLADPAAGPAVIAGCLEQWQRIDVLALIAGIAQYGPAAGISLAEWDRVIDINLRAPFLLAQAALPALEESCGSIVALSSIAGLQGWPYAAAYSAAKGGLVTMMKSLAIEYGPRGVRINVLAPGAVDTGLAADMRTPSFVYEESIRKRNTGLDGRKADPIEVARLIGFLVSAEASFVTGAVLQADGGAFA